MRWAEAGWDIGGSACALISAGLLAAGVPFGLCIPLSLFGAGASFLMLRRYYREPVPAAGSAGVAA